jgi:DNA-binding transcriptional MerR regulator
MRMAELSDRSGVPVATIKFYLREGLLPPGERTSPNQARYADEHVRRLRLVRALLDVGGLTVAGVREVLEAVDDDREMYQVLGCAQRNLELRGRQVDGPARERAARLAAEVAARRGWPMHDGDPVVRSFVDTLATLDSLGRPELAAQLDHYAELADRTAALDLAGLDGLTERETVVEAAVVGTVLGDTLLAAMRRLAQHHASAQRTRP